MGGGQSKKSEVKAVPQTQQKTENGIPASQPQQSAQSAPGGPASKPNIDMSPSPALSKKSGKSANLQQQSHQKYPVNTSQSSGLPRNNSDVDDMQSMARPSAVAKQSKMASPAPKQSKGNQFMEQQKRAEDEKMKQLQEISKQNRAKKAAAAAAQQKQNQMAVPSSGSGANQDEYFARDNSNKFQIDASQKDKMINGPSVMGGLNSAPLALSVTGKNVGAAAPRQKAHDQNQQREQFMMPKSAVAAPVLQSHFKVVSYQNDNNQGDWGGNQGQSTQGVGGLNVGVMGQTMEMEKNREIDMAELHELLGN